MLKRLFSLSFTCSALMLLLGECSAVPSVKINNDLFINNLKKCLIPLSVDSVKYVNIDLKENTPFKWDSVYYFSGETSHKQISDAIGFEWDGPGLSDDNRRLLFIHVGHVVSYTDFDKTAFNENESEHLPAHFYCCQELNNTNIEFCLYSSAKFVVYKNKSKYGVYYKFINTLCKN